MRRSSANSFIIPDVLIFEILNFIDPSIHFIISKKTFCQFIINNELNCKKLLPVSLLIALNNTTTFEDFHTVLLSYSFRENLACKVALKGNLATLQWFHSREITWNRYLLPTLASRGELELLEWAISNKLTLVNGKITKMTMGTILQRAACSGQVKILKWALESSMFDLEYFPVVLESAAGTDQLNIILWMINNYPSAMELMERTSNISLCYHAVSGNSINILEWLKREFPNSFWIERFHNNKNNPVCVTSAAHTGNIRMLAWLKQNEFQLNCERVTEAAVSSKENSLETLQYLRSFNCPWSDNVCVEAVNYGRLDILLWAVSNGCPWKLKEILEAAAHSKIASVDILQWITDKRFDVEDINVDFNLIIHDAIEYHNFIFVKWAKSTFATNFWDDRIIKKAAAAGDLPALIWAFEVNPDSITSEVIYVLSVNAAAGGHLHVLNWLLANYNSYKASILHPQVCVLAAKYGYLNVLQWAVANGCNWNKSHCCTNAIEYKKLKVLIWMKFQAPLYSQYESTFWYGDSYLSIFSSKCYCEGDVIQWLILNFGKEEGVYFEKRLSSWRKIAE